MRYLIVGDIHGCVDQFREYYNIFSNVDKVIFVGDYVDRGYNSLLCLKLAMELDNGITLLGNHEIKYYLRFLKGNIDYIPRDIDISRKMEFWDTLLKLMYRYGKPKNFYKDDNIFVSHAPSFLWQHNIDGNDRILTHGLKTDRRNEDGYKIVALPEELYNGEVSQKPIVYG
ncbi:MAG: metallophosphoesterase, partial [Atribacterota bacterium]